ncbi:MAG: hypothetical protein GY904_09560, partial [Planctomycetaceae bacterium]|nr:hypothetical protein [Planctomycetaceae bacterium]
KRVVGLYRTPLFPFFRGKLSRIDEILSYQGKVVSVERQDALDAAEMTDAMESEADEQVSGGGEGNDGEGTSAGDGRELN